MTLFGNQWLSSVFVSQDPVAIDSVGLDLLNEEFPLGRGKVPQSMTNADNYLHEAALVDRPPSGTIYRPNGPHAPLESLGVHEHWNDPAKRQYSRNLGRDEGIELVALGDQR